MKKLSLILVALLALLCLLPALADTATLPTVVPAESEDAFLGHWELSGAALFGMYMAADQLGVTASLQDAGIATLEAEGEDIEADIRPCFENNTDYTEWHADTPQIEAIGKRPFLRDDAKGRR